MLLSVKQISILPRNTGRRSSSIKQCFYCNALCEGGAITVTVFYLEINSIFSYYCSPIQVAHKKIEQVLYIARDSSGVRLQLMHRIRPEEQLN